MPHLNRPREAEDVERYDPRELLHPSHQPVALGIIRSVGYRVGHARSYGLALDRYLIGGVPSEYLLARGQISCKFYRLRPGSQR